MHPYPMYAGMPYPCAYPCWCGSEPWWPCHYAPEYHHHQEPVQHEHKHEHRPQTVPEEIYVETSTPSASAVIGGTGRAALTLEYMPDGSGTAAVNVKITDTEGSSDVNLNTIAAGYHVRSEFLSVEPGAKVTLTVTAAMARLRWFEHLS